MPSAPRICIAAHHGQDPDPGTPAPHCQPVRGAHLDSCQDEKCRGCMPRLAAPGSQVCSRCRTDTREHVADLGLLHVHLLTPTQAGPGGPRPEGTERPAALGDGALDARTAIERCLTAWSATLDKELGAYPWGEQTQGRWIARPPLALAHWVPATTLPDRSVLSMSARVWRHADRLLADPEHADQLVHDIAAVWREARRRAYPTKPVGKVIGECPVGRGSDQVCGGTVRAVVDVATQTGWGECGTCKTGGVIEWWQAQMPAEKWLGMKALRFHLLINCGRSVAEQTIRDWAAGAGDDPAELPTQPDPQSGRIQYEVTRARELAALQRGRGRPRIAQPA